jgi:Na+/proline symporter
MVILGVLFVVFVPWTMVTGDGITAFLQILTLENVRSIFVPPGLYFGIIISISLFTAPFVNQFIWQRVFAIKESKLKQSFTLAGVLFFFIPFGISILGFIAATQSLGVDNPVLAGYVPMAQYLPEVVSTIVFVILATALLSTADSALVACASILAIDFGNILFEIEIDEVRMTRVSMTGVAVVVGLAALGPFNLLDWLLFNAAIGAVLIAPLLMSIYREQDLNPQRVFYGLTIAILVSFPLFTYATLQNDNPLRILALIVGFLISTVPLLVEFESFKSTYKKYL